jgi:hypothetical protein
VSLLEFANAVLAGLALIVRKVLCIYFFSYNAYVAVKSISIGQPVSGTVASKSWTYYSATVTSGKTLNIQVTSNAGDVDVYIKYNAIPDLWSYDYRDTSAKKNFSIEITAPQMGVWYFGFYGFTATTYSFVVQTTSMMPFRYLYLHIANR